MLYTLIKFWRCGSIFFKHLNCVTWIFFLSKIWYLFFISSFLILLHLKSNDILHHKVNGPCNEWINPSLSSWRHGHYYWYTDFLTSFSWNKIFIDFGIGCYLVYQPLKTYIHLARFISRDSKVNNRIIITLTNGRVTVYSYYLDNR